MARILLVEDDRDQRDLRRAILQRFGHDVDGCSMPLEAEAAVASHTPDLVVMDLRLPNASDGRALVRAIRAQHPRLPIIVCSGWADDLENTPERQAVQALMRKPVNTNELIELIQKLLPA
jgi:CheY-like chemotaxis protein